MAVLSMDSVTSDITPVVLVGGSSRRFGRDKLREPLHDGTWLVDHPVAALREVFGPRVALVGACDKHIKDRADLVIDDPYPDAGPIGGVVAALEHSGTSIFVLAGDLRRISARTVRLILARSVDTQCEAVLGRTDRLEPCIGLYHGRALPALHARLASQRRSLHDALAPDRILAVPIDAREAMNVNRPEDLL